MASQKQNNGSFFTQDRDTVVLTYSNIEKLDTEKYSFLPFVNLKRKNEDKKWSKKMFWASASVIKNMFIRSCTANIDSGGLQTGENTFRSNTELKWRM